MNQYEYQLNRTQNQLARTIKKWSAYQKASDDFTTSLNDLQRSLFSIQGLTKDIASCVGRQQNKKIKELERTISALEREVSLKKEIDHQGIEIGKTWAVFDFLFDNISGHNHDVKLVLLSGVFDYWLIPIMQGDLDKLLPSLPPSYRRMVERGKEEVELVLSEMQTAFSHREMWEQYAPYLQDWVKTEVLQPLCLDPIDDFVATSYEDMIVWDTSPSERDSLFPELYDMSELYRRHKTEIIDELKLAKAQKNLDKSFDE